MLRLISLFPFTTTIYAVIVIYKFVKYQRVFAINTDPDLGWTGWVHMYIIRFINALLWPLFLLPYLRVIPFIIGLIVTLLLTPILTLLLVLTGGLKVLAAEDGDAEAMCNLGVSYANGQGVPQDYGEAVKWFRKAVDEGYAEAMFNLGVLYEHGQGVNQDYGEAVKWYRKAAVAGDAEAMYNLGGMYYNGQGVSQDKAEGVRWVQKAARKGQKKAQDFLRRLGEGW